MAGLVFTFANGDTISTDYVINTFSITENYYNKLKPVDNSAKVSAVFSVELSNALKLHADEDIECVISSSEGEVLFTGYLRKNFSFTKTQRNQPISLEVVSPSYFLDTELTENIFQTGQTVGALVKLLFAQSKLDVPVCGLSDTVDYFYAEEGDNIYDTLQELLFEYGYTFDFDKNGVFVTYELFNEPGTEKHSFTGSNCLNQITITRNEKEYTGVSAEWQKKEYVEDGILYEDTNGATSSLACSIDVEPGTHMYTPDNDSGDVELQYDSTKGEVLHVDNIELSANGTYIGLLQTHYENKGTYVNWNCYNPSASVTATYHKFQFTGDAWVCTSTNQTKTDTIGDKCDSITLSYLNSTKAVKALIAKIANYYRYSMFNTTVQSKDDVELGSFCTVTDNGIGTITGRIIQKTTSYTGIYTYTIESVTAYEAAEVTEEKAIVDRTASTGTTSFVAELKEEMSAISAQGMRTLTSLEETGTNNEVAIYNGWFYQYSSATSSWTGVNRSDYLGVYTSLPETANKENFVMMGVDYTTECQITTSGGLILLNELNFLGVSFTFKKGTIYVYDGEVWNEITDKNNYRYLIATNDLFNTTGEVSPALASAVKSSSGAESYLGAFVTAPTNPALNNYFLYIGETDTEFVKGKMYQWNGDTWNAIDSSSTKAYTYFMTALKDMYANNITTEVGAFATLFCQTLVAQTAFIEKLQTQIIQLTDTGRIEGGSKVYGVKYKVTKSSQSQTVTLYNFNYYDEDEEKWVSVISVISSMFSSIRLGSYNETTQSYEYSSLTDCVVDTEYTLYTKKFRVARDGSVLLEKDTYFIKDEGFVLESDGDMYSKNYDEENQIGYKLGKDGIIHANQMIANGGAFENASVNGKFISKNGIYFSNYIKWDSTTDLSLLFNLLSSNFPNYITGHLMCVGTLNFRVDTTIYESHFKEIRYGENDVGQIFFSCDDLIIGKMYGTCYMGTFRFFKTEDTYTYDIEFGSSSFRSGIDNFALYLYF